jgi:hypothetical protein
MAKSDDFDDDFDYLKEDEEMEFIDNHERRRRSVNPRKELERHLEMKRLREMLEDEDLSDFD